MADSLPHGFPTPFHFDMALLEPVHAMMQRGIKVDMNEKSRLSKEYHEKWQEKQEDLNSIAGRELNVNSSKQIKQWLYRDLNLPPRKHNGKLTTREEKLRNLASKCKEKVDTLKTKSGKERWIRGFLSIMLILQIRSLRKRIQSYIDIDVDPDFRMRTTLSIGGTETGRFSSSKTLWDTGCNLQTIPYELRQMFIADEGKVLGEFDLNRGESWIYSHLAEDPTMMRIHREGLDFHAETAATLSGEFSERQWNREEIHKGAKVTGNDEAYKLRYLGKRSNHAYAYRMGPYRAAEVINEQADETGITVRVSDTKKMRRLWLNKYVAIKQWWKRIENELNEDRTMETPYGRRRQFFHRWGDKLFKEATAYVPQSTSVDYLNVGLLRVWHELDKEDAYGIEVLHQNHDSLLIQWDKGETDKAVPAIVECMSNEVTVNGYDLVIPIEPEIGKNWGELEELDIDHEYAA